MNNIPNNDEPAFPATSVFDQGTQVAYTGLTKREWFAGQAMAGDFAEQRVQVGISDLILRERAQLYLRAADELITALKEPKP